MSKGRIGLMITVLVFVVVIIGLIAIPILVKNNLIEKDETVDAAWAQIDTQLQRRMDLIPNLVNTVKGYAKHEKELFTTISEARGKLLSAKTPSQKASANQTLETSIGRLLAIAESYPNLKADQSFIRLQDELAGTENRITVARSRYNKAVKIYNASIRKFPGNIFAESLKMSEQEYFKALDRSKAKIPLKLNFKGKKMAKLLKKKDTEKIVVAIKKAENETSGEIMVHIQKKVKGDIFEVAKSKFDELGMSETEEKNGVLIFVAVHDKEFTIIGDEGIDKKVPDNFWQETVDKMVPFFADNKIPEAIEKGVLSIGEQLKEFFPYQKDDVNELSDEVSIGE